MIKLEVPRSYDGASLSQCIRELAGLGSGEVTRLLMNGVRVNGRPQRSGRLNKGDVVEVYPQKGYPAGFFSLEVVYEDENIMVCSKMPGLASDATKLDGKDTLFSLAQAHMMARGEADRDGICVPYLIYRLDRDTGGLVLVAKHQMVFEQLLSALRERRIEQYYYAVCAGRPRQRQEILHDFLHIERRTASVRVMERPEKYSAPIATRYTTLETKGALSLLEVEPFTLRPHQIRAHLAFAGLPVLGDMKYGDMKANKQYGIREEMLWAHRLVLHMGHNNPLEYLDGCVFETDTVALPRAGMPHIPGGEQAPIGSARR